MLLSLREELAEEGRQAAIKNQFGEMAGNEVDVFYPQTPLGVLGYLPDADMNMWSLSIEPG